MRRWGLTPDLVWLTASMSLWGLGFGLYGFLWPLYVEHLGGSAVIVGFLSTVAGVATALVVLPGGYLADRIDRKALLFWGWAVAIPVPFMFAWAPTWQWLLPGVLLYFGSAFSTPALQAVIVAEAPAARLSTAYNVVMSVFGLGMVVGPSVGGYLATHYSYRLIFILSGMLYALSTVCLLPINAHPPDRHPRSSPPHWHPRTRPRFFQWVVFSGILAVVQGLTWPFVVPYLKDVGHLPLETIGLLTSAGILAGTVTAPLWGRVAERVGLPRSIGFGLGLVTLGFLVLLWNPAQAGWALASGMLRGGGEGARGLAGVAVGRTVRGEEAGTAYGVYNLVTEMAGALAPIPGGYLYARGPYLPLTLTTFLTGILAWWLMHDLPGRPKLVRASPPLG